MALIRIRSSCLSVSALLVLLFWFGGGASLSRAWCAELIINSEMQFDYAMECFDSGDFSTALTEFKRFTHFFPEDSRQAQAVFLTGVALFNLDRLEEAADLFHAVTRRGDDDPLALEAGIMVGRILLKQGRGSQAETRFRNLLMLAEDVGVRDRIHAALGWIWLEKAGRMEPGALDKAASWFEKISPENREKYSAPALLGGIKTMEGLKEKSPAVAGALGVIPGGGFAYTGRLHDAAVAFLVNTGLIAATIRSFEENNPVLGAMVGLVASGFYAGNIYGGISSAYKHNSLRRQGIINPRRPPTSPPTDLSAKDQGKSRIQFSLSFPF